MTFSWVVWNETISFRIGWESQLFLCLHPGTDPEKTMAEVQQFPDHGSAPVGIPRVLCIVGKYFPELTLIFEETRKGEGNQDFRINRWLKGRRIRGRRKCPGSGLAGAKTRETWAQSGGKPRWGSWGLGSSSFNCSASRGSQAKQPVETTNPNPFWMADVGKNNGREQTDSELSS